MHKLALSVAVSTAGINYWPHLGPSTVPQHQLMFPAWRGHRSEPGIKHSFYFFPRGLLALEPEFMAWHLHWGQLEQEHCGRGASPICWWDCSVSLWPTRVGPAGRWEMGKCCPAPIPSASAISHSARHGFCFQMGFRCFTLLFQVSTKQISWQEQSGWARGKPAGLQNVKTFGCIL